MFKLLFSFVKRPPRFQQLKSSETTPWERDLIAKIVKERDFLVTLTPTVFDCIDPSLQLKLKQDARWAAGYFPPRTVLQLHKFEAQE